MFLIDDTNRLMLQQSKVRIVYSTYCRVRVDPVGSLAGVIEETSTEGLGLNQHINDGFFVLGNLQVVLLGSLLSIKLDVVLICFYGGVKYTLVESSTQILGITL